ncbi:MAG: hypothetical protein COU29_04145 [Candidatus Magasanikbacteria bacterium CG10_big_fil_rev_8_21_14_0_10_36_32]|uniref:Glycosyltransferase 2-like domain-containing protein n=1 Tax=Candidatus Magasanikbacteria bacterium CG10_big_fil_rev_8_21_14_0_10_36_32 TaxID=1974646 RepID=A0A2M6W5X0_9BACT|nr:MAG: hypothetical protein COU29_04145 [Candidatus Magasanikbacteria bacterium CG10_big_fil_rev_8_21_14_0_10_36_32]
MSEIKVSINLITYNRADFIVQAMDSILLQTFSDWELIIIDDASTDNTKELVDSYLLKDSRIKYVKQENRCGISRSRNAALKLSVGKYIAVLDSDDVWSDSNKLKKQVEFLDNNSDYCLVGCGVEVINKQGDRLKKYCNPGEDEEIRKTILIKNPFAHSSVAYRKQTIDQLIGYDESLKIGEDYDLWLRMGKVGKMANLNNIFIFYRKHTANISVLDRNIALQNNFDIISKYKEDYPNYFLAYWKRKIRKIIYSLIKP